MFTGLVQAVGRVSGMAGGRLVVEVGDEVKGAGGVWEGEGWVVGESVAVQGVCLTVVDGEGGLAFDLSEETLARTSLGGVVAGSRVNLERAMRLGDRFGGHIVQGHVDGLGRVLEVEELAGSWRMRFDVGDGGRYLVDKGSVTLDGVSLTVVSPVGGAFDVAVIPHTWAVTSLSERRAGDLVNVEYDVLAKHVERLLGWRG